MPAEYGVDESPPFGGNGGVPRDAVPMLGLGSGVLGITGLSGVLPLLPYCCCMGSSLRFGFLFRIAIHGLDTFARGFVTFTRFSALGGSIFFQ